MKGANVVAHRIDFSGDATDIGNISYYEANGSLTTSINLLNLYGWSFEKEEGFEAIILNLGNLEYDISDACSLGIFSTSSNCPQSIVQLKAIDPTAGIGSIDILPVGSLKQDRLYTSGEIPIAIPNHVSIPPYSLTRIIYRNPGRITLRLTDDEICKGTTTSVLVQGANFNSTITLEVKQGSTTVYSNSISDSLFHLPTNLDPGTYTLFANDGSVTSDPVNLIILPAMSVTAAITSGNNIPCLADQDITLTADINTTSTATYSYLWVPDKHILDNNPFQQSIVLDNENLTTQAYQVFVFDGQCWASSNLITFDRGPSSVDLGDDFTVCDNNLDFDLRAITTYAFVDNSLFHYRLLQDNTEIATGQLSDFNVPNPGVGNWTYRVEVWTDNGTISSEDCPIWDEVVVNVVACCSCSSAIALSPTPHVVVNEPVNNYADEGELIDQAMALGNDFTVFPSNGDATTVTITQDDPAYSICINGEFWIRNANRGSNNLETLVLQKCTLRLGENGKIKIRGRVKLVFKGCLVESCNGTTMWDGVYSDITNQAIKEPEIEITDYISTRTIIRHARNAVVLRRDSPFMIEKCDFDNNYVDVLMEKYNKSMSQDRSGNGVNAFSQKNYIRSCSFSKTGALLAPYTGIQKLAGIRLRDVERVVIGDSSMHSSVSANTFSNASYGIMGYNAGFECYNNTFSNINYDVDGTSAEEKHKGSCIYSYSASDYNDRKTIIGCKNFNAGAPASHKNIFTSSVNGIVSVGEMNLKVFNNVFGSGSTNERLVNYGIWTHGSNKKSAYITRGNEFYDYYVGIRSFGIHPDGIYHIGFNNFFNAYIPNWSVVNSFQGTAIHMSNSYVPPSFIGQSEVPPINIYNNEIGQINDEAEIEPRIGIFTSNIYQPIIQNNNIYYFRAAQVSKPHSIGIWAQNCIAPRVAGNLILEHQNINQGYGANLIGMKFDRNINPCIGSQNITENLGYGLSFWDNNGQVALSTNQFTNCDNGVNLDWAEIGTQGDPDRTDDNGWTDRNVSPVLNRVNGLTLSNLPIRWYYQPTPAEFSPLPSGSVNATIINSPGNPPIDCPIIQNVASRNQTFGYVIGDSARYEVDYKPSFSYSAKMITYKTLKRDTSLMYMDDETDESFIDFYNAMGQSNIEKYDSVALLITQGEFAVAAALLAGIEDTNDQETFLTNFYTLYLTKIVYDSLLSNADSSLLIEIAYSHSLFYGDAVYLARNALFLEIHDETLESNLRRAVFRKQPIERNLSAQPNPASERTQIKMNAEDYSGRMQLLDGHGRLIIDRNLQNGWLDVKSLNPGVYFIKIPEEDSSSILCKLVIIR
ncbi:MAG: T9SS type A sorting domain-containing protein [Bacteroidetes bacterium]|nr:T9SS type A sorting domain-containing protein [Bacteroidota bacterium]